VTTPTTNAELPNGPVAAALVAGGLGAATLGLLTVLAEASKAVSGALNWWNPAGPLAGKTLVGTIAFFASWLVLHFIFRGRNVNFARAATIALVLLGLGLLGTFPPFFDLFAPAAA
jgi:hypothetical protein